MPEKKVGLITHVFGKISVAVLKATDSGLAVGDTIHIKGKETDFTQQVESMQIDHDQIEKIEPGQEAGLKVTGPVHDKDEVYRVVD